MRIRVWFGFLLLLAPAARAQEPPLTISVQYPPAGAAVAATDSTFVFGRVEGADDRTVAVVVNGRPVPVHPGGGWLAFVPVAPDSFTFRVRASVNGRNAAVDHTVWVPRSTTAPGDSDLGYKPSTIQPTSTLEIYTGDTVRVSVIAAPGQEVFALLAGELAPLAPDGPREDSRGRQAFGEIGGTLPAATGSWLRYRADVYARNRGSVQDSLALLFRRPNESDRVVPVTTVTFLDPSAVRVAVVDDDTAGTGRTDHRVMGRAGPDGVFDVFLLNGTRVALGRFESGRREVVLGAGKSVWIDPTEAFPIDAPRPASEVPDIRTRVVEGWSEVIVPLTERLPFDIAQWLDPARYRVTIWGATAHTDVVRLVFDDDLIRAIQWGQLENETVTLDVELDADQAWGWRSYWEGSSLVLSFRHPPFQLTDGRFRSPLRAIRVIVDPGHSPDTGAVGPTGLVEADVNLDIALRLADILRQRGAEVVLTRATRDSALGPYDRTNLAVAASGEIFVSIHNNALPDGVNPFVNNGTSVLFYHPQSQPLAEAIQAELLDRTGLPDYGVWHDNLAVTRMNEMPSVLIEGAFVIIPEQEAMLRTSELQRRIAEAVAAGIERFLNARRRSGARQE